MRPPPDRTPVPLPARQAAWSRLWDALLSNGGSANDYEGGPRPVQEQAVERADEAPETQAGEAA